MLYIIYKFFIDPINIIAFYLMDSRSKKKFNISLIVNTLKDLEKVYIELNRLISIHPAEFISNKLIIDKARADFNLAFETLMRVCRHVTQVMGLTRVSGKECLYRLAMELNMEDPGSYKELSDFYFSHRDLREDIDPSFFYSFIKKRLILFKQMAGAVVEHVKKVTNNPLLIDYDLLKQKYFYIKDSVKKIDFALSQGKEEFVSKPMYYDRTRYFYIVAYDSLFDICSHLAPKFGIKKFGDDCLIKLVEEGIVDKSYEDKIREMYKFRNTLGEKWEVDKELMYEKLKELNDSFLPIAEQIFKYLKSKLT